MDPILITGGHGFLGTWCKIVAREQGIDFCSLDIKPPSDYVLSVTDLDPNWASTTEFSAVIHLAGILGTDELFDDVETAIDINIRGTLKVLDLCRFRKIPFIGVAMDHVWINPYETTRLAAERLSLAWSKEYGVPVTWVRAYNVFGEYQAIGNGHPLKIIPTFSRYAWERKPLPIWGSGNQMVDLVYARDVAKIILQVATGDGYPTYVDAGTGVGMSVDDVAQAVYEYTWGNGNTPCPKCNLDMRRGELVNGNPPIAVGAGWDSLNWKPEYRASDLQRTVEWYRHIEAYP